MDEIPQPPTDDLALPGATQLLQELLAARRVPRATYRLQLHAGFTFRDALGLVDYLDDLGISDLYLSPILQARTGSTHGYDVVDHGRINAELGTREDLDALTEALRARGMSLLLDVVPNHVGIGKDNPWWNDVLESGPASPFAPYFDITWSPANRNLENKVLLPLLEDQYGVVLEAGKIRLGYDEGAFALHYHAHRLPVAPDTFPLILQPVADALALSLGEESDQVRELRSILTALGYLPSRTDTSPEKIAERSREKEIVKARLARLVQFGPDVAVALADVVRGFNGTVGEPATFDRLDQLIDVQSYRPAFWRVATEEINYRRFFDVNDLAAIRVERPEVFQATHRLLFELIAEGRAGGMRIDHPDGLWDPAGYFRQVQEEFALAWLRRRLHPRPLPPTLVEEFLFRLRDWLGKGGAAPLYVVAEKILTEGEELPRDWLLDGTTGYDFLNLVNGLFVDGSRAEVFTEIHAEFLGRPVEFADLVNEAKKMIMLVSLASEINALSQRLDRLSERNRRCRDFTLISLTYVTREILACLPVYRTYITGLESVSDRDRAFIEAAVAQAKAMNPRTAESIFDFVGDTLLLQNIDAFREEDRSQVVEWVMRFQQVSGPVTAKGVEDTALYVFNRLTSLNEVGGHPDHFGTSAEEFHQASLERLRTRPHGLLTTATHDTKRGEDVRTRLDVLSEIPDIWRGTVTRWGRANAELKVPLADGDAPDSNDEYLLYQTLLGVFPSRGSPPGGMGEFRARIAAYMRKATKEAKIHTSWINAGEDYDDAVQQFVDRLLPDEGGTAFLADLQELAAFLDRWGSFNALSQVLLKATSPGVPDFYQGCELPCLSLVDPDNRRDVDFVRRRAELAEIAEETAGAGRAAFLAESLAHVEDGRAKFFLTRELLACRRREEKLFREGDYLPLETIGAKQQNAIAFRRSLEDRAAVVVAPRLIVGLTGGQGPPLGKVWEDTWILLPEEERGRKYRNVLTSELHAVEIDADVPGLPLAKVLARFPVALLIRER